MFAFTIIAAAILFVGFLITVHTVWVDLPPKAHLLCRVWQMVERRERE